MPRRRVPFGLTHTWTSQAVQYERRTDIPVEPGLVHWTVPRDEAPVPIECLLAYTEDPQLVGILNYYPEGSPFGERPGDFLVLVHPAHRRKGLGTLLIAAADARWHLNLEEQAYTPEGEALADAYLALRHKRQEEAG